MMDPKQAMMAKGLQARRGGTPAPDDMMAREVPEKQAPSGLAEIRAHLTTALELLDNMGAGDVA